MRKSFPLVLLLFTTAAAHASFWTNLVGFPRSRVLLNATCQGMLAHANGTDGAGAIATLREHRVRTLGGATAEAELRTNFGADDRSGARKYARLAGHLRGIERWTAVTKGPVHGIVYRGSAAIAGHFARLDDVREMMEGGPEGNVDGDGMLTGTRLIFNFISIASLFNLAVAPSWGSWGFAAALLGIANPVAANRSLLFQDRSVRTFEDRVNQAVRSDGAGRWIFNSRTYVVRAVLVDALRTNDVLKIAAALRDTEMMDHFPAVARTVAKLIGMDEDPGFLAQYDEMAASSYLIVDQLLRFDPETSEPTLVITVRFTNTPPKKIFATRPSINALTTGAAPSPAR